MPKTEEEFKLFLEGVGAQIVPQAKVSDCPFLKRGVHKVDFMITNNCGEFLYVEVKGYLSYYAVNVLEYLLRYSDESIYVYQATDEDWMGRPRDGQNGQDKIEQNKKVQQKEVRDFLRGKLSAKEMQCSSLERLKAYKRLRAGDVKRWRQMQKSTKKGKVK